MAAACGEWSVVGEAEDGTRIAVPLRCRAWTCPDCGRWLKSRLLRRLGQAKAHALLTLTVNPAAFLTPEDAFAKVSLAVGLLFKRIKTRIAPDPIEYFLVWETTRAGWPHAHILLRSPYIPQRWLSAQWADLAGSPIIDVRAVRSKHAAAHYIAKYLTKAPAVPPGYKRYRSSRAFFEREEPNPAFADFPRMKWHREPMGAGTLAMLWKNEGLSVVTWHDGIVHAHPDELATLKLQLRAVPRSRAEPPPDGPVPAPVCV